MTDMGQTAINDLGRLRSGYAQKADVAYSATSTRATEDAVKSLLTSVFKLN
jgi:hypothetical protein